jgi:hypothetical protein
MALTALADVDVELAVDGLARTAGKWFRLS